MWVKYILSAWEGEKCDNSSLATDAPTHRINVPQRAPSRICSGGTPRARFCSLDSHARHLCLLGKEIYVAESGRFMEFEAGPQREIIAF